MMLYRASLAVVCTIAAAVFVVVGWPGSATAKTTIQGGNLGSQTWTTANDPYVLEGDVTVRSGSKLTIEAGVEVKVESSDYLQTGRNNSLVEVLIDGELEINGSQGNPVHIHGNSATSGSWYGLILGNAASSVSVDHVKIEHATDAITDEATGSSVTVRHMEASNNSQVGYDMVDGDPTLDNLDLHDNDDGVVVQTGAGGTISSSLIHSNSDDGVTVDCSQSTSVQTTIEGSTILQNASDGVYFGCNDYGSNKTVRVENSIVVGNADDGVDKRRSSTNYGTLEVLYSDVWNNGDDFDDTSAGTGTFSANPLFVSNQDPRLTENSPARNAGRNGNDIGALAYNGDPTPKLTGYLWSDTTWTQANSPYTVEGDITVASGVALTIEAGVEIEVESTDVMQAGASTDDVEIDIEGTLTSDGTAMDPVEFRGRSASAGTWNDLDIDPGGSADIRHTEIQHADNGLRLNTNNTVTIERSTFRDNAQAGILVEQGHPEIDGALFASNDDGMHIEADGGARIVNSIARSNSDDGFSIDCTQSSTESVLIHSSTIHANASDGVYFGCNDYGSNKTVELVNGIVTENSDDGVDKRRSSTNYGTFEVRYSNVWGNGDDYDDTSAGTGTISSRPQFTNPPQDLTLEQMSFCVDAGTNSDAPNHDYTGRSRPVDGDGGNGPEYDMGAHEYGADADCGDGAVGPGEVCDDGADNGDYGYCNGSCDGLAAHCGDGTVDGPEQCDDGEDNGTPGHCDAACSGQVAKCGNGEIEGDEVCDDGAMNGTYGHCKRNCSGMGPRCGDGTVDEPETCDDGNDSNNDGCLNNCTEASCGDGYVYDEEEECDDGNSMAGDGCSAMCTEEAGGGDTGMVDAGPDASGSSDAGSDVGGAEDDTGVAGDTGSGDDAGAGDVGPGGGDTGVDAGGSGGGEQTEGCGCRASGDGMPGGLLAGLLFALGAAGLRIGRRRR